MTTEKKILICLRSHPILSAKTIAAHIRENNLGLVMRTLVKLKHSGKVRHIKGLMDASDTLHDIETKIVSKYSLPKKNNDTQLKLF